MSNARFRGLGHVFSFTLGQMVKSRANIVSAVILLVMALVSVPLIQLTNGHGSVGPDVPAIVEQDGLTDAQRDILSSGITVITDDIAAPDEAPADELDGADDSMDGFWVQYGYAIVVMMLCMMSTAFLLRAVVEEKESKLVELLMVSVSPLALLGGKILAVMLYVAALLLLVLPAVYADLFRGAIGRDMTRYIRENGLEEAVEPQPRQPEQEESALGALEWDRVLSGKAEEEVHGQH